LSRSTLFPYTTLFRSFQTHCSWNVGGSRHFAMELPPISVVFEDFVHYLSGELDGLLARSYEPVHFACSIMQGNSCSCPKTNPYGGSLPSREGVENADS